MLIRKDRKDRKDRTNATNINSYSENKLYKNITNKNFWISKILKFLICLFVLWPATPILQKISLALDIPYLVLAYKIIVVPLTPALINAYFGNQLTRKNILTSSLTMIAILIIAHLLIDIYGKDLTYLASIYLFFYGDDIMFNINPNKRSAHTAQLDEDSNPDSDNSNSRPSKRRKITPSSRVRAANTMGTEQATNIAGSASRPIEVNNSVSDSVSDSTSEIQSNSNSVPKSASEVPSRNADYNLAPRLPRTSWTLTGIPYPAPTLFRPLESRILQGDRAVYVPQAPSPTIKVDGTERINPEYLTYQYSIHYIDIMAKKYAEIHKDHSSPYLASSDGTYKEPPASIKDLIKNPLLAKDGSIVLYDHVQLWANNLNEICNRGKGIGYGLAGNNSSIDNLMTSISTNPHWVREDLRYFLNNIPPRADDPMVHCASPFWEYIRYKCDIIDSKRSETNFRNDPEAYPAIDHPGAAKTTDSRLLVTSTDNEYWDGQPYRNPTGLNFRMVRGESALEYKKRLIEFMLEKRESIRFYERTDEVYRHVYEYLAVRDLWQRLDLSNHSGIENRGNLGADPAIATNRESYDVFSSTSVVMRR